MWETCECWQLMCEVVTFIVNLMVRIVGRLVLFIQSTPPNKCVVKYHLLCEIYRSLVRFMALQLIKCK